MTALLRPWSVDDAAALRDLATSNADVARQLGEEDVSTLESAQAFVARRLGFDDARRSWAVVENGVVVGNVGLGSIERRHGTAWVSYWLGPAARGKGYATRGLVAVSGWAFREGLFRLELGHRTNNPASCRVATAAGFRAEGVERQKLRYGAERFDVETHARLAVDPPPEVDGLPLAVS